jgi:hypothetical protein
VVSKGVASFYGGDMAAKKKASVRKSSGKEVVRFEEEAEAVEGRLRPFATR